MNKSREGKIYELNTLYKDLDSLIVMESLQNQQFDFVFLDVPRCKLSDFICSENEYLHGAKSIRHYLAAGDGGPLNSISIENVETEKARLNKWEIKKYSDYIARIFDNAYRLTKDSGFVALFVSGEDLNEDFYKTHMRKRFPSRTSIIIEQCTRNVSGSHNYATLIIYSKQNNYQFPMLMEQQPLDLFHYIDDRDHYSLRPLFDRNNFRKNYVYEWKGIFPIEGTSWKYSKEKLDQLYSENRIVIKNNRVYLKYYRSEHPVKASSVWKAKLSSDSSKFCTIDLDSMEKLFSLYMHKGDSFFCPFDRDGIITMFADKHGLEWKSVSLSMDNKAIFASIPNDHYVTITTLNDIPNCRYYKTQPDVFISYSSKENTIANRVKNVLESNEINCWMAPDSIPLGSNYIEEIPKALRNSRVFVLLLSECSQQSQWVPKELEQAIKYGKVIIPIHLDQSDILDSIDLLLAGVQRIEAYQDLNKSLQFVIKQIMSLIAS